MKILSLAVGQKFFWFENNRLDFDAIGSGYSELILCNPLPFIECGGQSVPIIHDLSDAGVIFSAKSRCNMRHLLILHCGVGNLGAGRHMTPTFGYSIFR